jgi:hypothetical protein
LERESLEERRVKKVRGISATGGKRDMNAIPEGSKVVRCMRCREPIDGQSTTHCARCAPTPLDTRKRIERIRAAALGAQARRMRIPIALPNSAGRRHL